jgi:membrane protein implicated in regulation of membrane protease activity
LRTATIALALAAFIVAVAFLARAIVLAASGLGWELPGWLADLSSDAGRASAAAGAAAAALAAFCLIAVWRLATPRGERRDDVVLGQGAQATVLRVGALERMLEHAIGRDVGELRGVRVRLCPGRAACAVSVAGMVGPADLVGLHARVREVSRCELERAAGIEVGTLDLDVDGFSR